MTALSALSLADVARIVELDASGARSGLAALLDRLSTQLRALSDALSTTYLNNLTPGVAPSRHLGPGVSRPSDPPPPGLLQVEP